MRPSKKADTHSSFEAFRIEKLVPPTGKRSVANFKHGNFFVSGS